MKKLLKVVKPNDVAAAMGKSGFYRTPTPLEVSMITDGLNAMARGCTAYDFAKKACKGGFCRAVAAGLIFESYVAEDYDGSRVIALAIRDTNGDAYFYVCGFTLVNFLVALWPSIGNHFVFGATMREYYLIDSLYPRFGCVEKAEKAHIQWSRISALLGKNQVIGQFAALSDSPTYFIHSKSTATILAAMDEATLVRLIRGSDTSIYKWAKRNLIPLDPHAEAWDEEGYYYDCHVFRAALIMTLLGRENPAFRVAWGLPQSTFVRAVNTIDVTALQSLKKV